jgi:hypothetical protein
MVGGAASDQLRATSAVRPAGVLERRDGIGDDADLACDDAERHVRDAVHEPADARRAFTDS